MSGVPYEFDSDYVQALRRGDPAAEAHFADYFNPILLRMLTHKLHSVDRARDVRQEAFLRVLSMLRSGRQINKPERFEMFVKGVCNNIVREAYREQCRFVALSSLETEPIVDSPSAYRLVVAAENRRQVYQLFARVTAGERAILKAIFLENQSRGELCRRLGVSRGYLRVLLHRAKERIGVQMQKNVCRTAWRNSRELHGNAKGKLPVSKNLKAGGL
jgi:RNA polymerase sigma-70 factor (ECF subfamily)